MLSFKQWLMESVDSASFKTWFGKSLLQKNNVPTRFYHGTNVDIAAFNYDFIGKGTDQFGSGFYFTDRPDVASGYAERGETNGSVIPVYLRVLKPIKTSDTSSFTRLQITKLIVGAPDYKESLENFGDISQRGLSRTLNDAAQSYTDIQKPQAIWSLSNDFYRNHNKEFLINLTKITGHDAVIDIHDGHTIVNVFHPNQIKSAIGNSGNYTKKSNNIND